MGSEFSICKLKILGIQKSIIPIHSPPPQPHHHRHKENGREQK